MITKNLTLEIKSVDEQGRFSGFAAYYSNVDSDGEVIDPGCFKRSVAHSQGKVPILWAHDSKTPIGWGLAAEDQKQGLYVEAQLMLNTEQGRYAYEYAKLGNSVGGNVGISVGFRPVKDGVYVKDGVRHFREAQLLEYSLCVFQANPLAQVASVKDQKEPEATDMAFDVALISKALRGEAVELSDELKSAVASFKSTIDAQAKAQADVLVKQMVASDFIEKDDMSDDSGESDPGSFEDAMSDQRAEHEMSDDHRYRIEMALHKCISNIKCSGLSKSSKHQRITKALHQYADAMADWHGKSLDAEYGPVKSAEGENEEKSANAASVARKLRRARAHMKEGHALIDAGHQHIMKGYRVVSDLSKLPYLHNDVNAPNPVGGGKADLIEQQTKSTDPDLHSVIKDDIAALLASLKQR